MSYIQWFSVGQNWTQNFFFSRWIIFCFLFMCSLSHLHLSASISVSVASFRSLRSIILLVFEWPLKTFRFRWKWLDFDKPNTKKRHHLTVISVNIVHHNRSFFQLTWFLGHKWIKPIFVFRKCFLVVHANTSSSASFAFINLICVNAVKNVNKFSICYQVFRKLLIRPNKSSWW